MGRKSRDKQGRARQTAERRGAKGKTSEVESKSSVGQAPASAKSKAGENPFSGAKTKPSTRRPSTTTRKSKSGVLKWPAGAARMLTALAFVTGLAYVASFDVDFQLDDKDQIQRNSAVIQPFSLSAIMATQRPFTTATFALNHALAGPSLAGYHLGNLLVHLTCGVAVYLFAFFTLSLPTFEGRYDKWAPFLALVTAALFLLHPVQTESVTYLIQRAEALVSVALLVALLFSAASAELALGVWVPVVLACVVLGMLSKPSFFVAPVLFLLYDWAVVSGRSIEGIRRRLPAHAILGVTSILAFAYIWSGTNTGTQAGFEMEGLTPLQYLSAQFGVLLYYARIVFLPNRLCFDCGLNGAWPVWSSVIGDGVLVPAAILAAVGVAALLLVRRQPLFALWVWGSAILLAPTSSFFPLADFYVEHRLYLPIALWALFVVAGAHDLGAFVRSRVGWSEDTTKRLAYTTAAFVCGVLFLLTSARNAVWADPVALWEESVSLAPQSPRSTYNLGNAYKRAGEQQKAITQYVQTLEVDPSYAMAYANLGSEYMKLERYAEAAEVFEGGVKVKPNFAVNRRNLARAYAAQGLMSQAIAAAEAAVEVDPRSGAGRRLLGSYYQNVGRTEEARQAYQAALEISPTDSVARNALRSLGG